MTTEELNKYGDDNNIVVLWTIDDVEYLCWVYRSEIKGKGNTYEEAMMDLIDINPYLPRLQGRIPHE